MVVLCDISKNIAIIVSNFDIDSIVEMPIIKLIGCNEEYKQKVDQYFLIENSHI